MGGEAWAEKPIQFSLTRSKLYKRAKQFLPHPRWLGAPLLQFPAFRVLLLLIFSAPAVLAFIRLHFCDMHVFRLF
jgi:hypothetical protein